MGQNSTRNKTLFGLLKEETKDLQAPSFNHLIHKNIPTYVHNNNNNNTTTTTSSMPSPDDSSELYSRSPESIWTRSPPPWTPMTPLVYRCISSLRHQGNIYSISVSKLGLVFTGSNTSHIRAWQLLDCSEKGYIQSNSCKIQALLSYDDMLFSSHKDHKIRVWNIRDNSQSHTNFSPRKVITLPKSSNNPLKLFLSRASSRQHKDTISCMAYNHDDGVLYTGSWDKTVKSWRLIDGKCVDSFVAHANNINDMVIDREGFLVTCSSDGTIKVWTRVCGETFHTLTMTLSFHPFPIYALALNEDGLNNRTFLYSGSSDGNINYWGQHYSDRYTHGGSIQAHQFAILCLTTIKNLVISGSEDALIKIWRRSGEGKMYHECVVVLEGHKGPVKCLSSCLEKDVGSTGFLVCSASTDQTFKIWRVKVSPENKEDITLQDIKVNGYDNGNNNNNEDDDITVVDETTNNNNKGFISSSPVLSPTWLVKKFNRSSNCAEVA